MVDRLAVLLERFPVSAQVFHAGPLCGINTLEGERELGQLHLVQRGPVEVFHGGETVCVDRPSLLLYPRPLTHRFATDPERGADMACANLRFEGGAQNPVAAALPAFVCLPLEALHGTGPVLALLFEEAFARNCGRQAMVDRLFEVVMIQVLRQLMERGELRGGMLAGLSHPRLRHAMVAMHESPAREWTLEDLAAAAGMSRSVFASAFRERVGLTPGHYLQGWRVGLAQRALRQGRPLKVVAAEIGYGSEAALSRAFKAHCGLSPRAWKQQDAAAAAE
ncbi:AraC family transcriptional regulator [Pseudoxanthomonas broegbernensis]|uniref:AraC family transcriptional regulator n=1 Tax=Pseudoxanthomonas broegbernensis TaxID=83619 RepID=A0A7V8K706_9GAMM|nr:AraC family transcriptional regulator [Pseudoxanthomonas broegbernensis]KAF1685999.1 AraC family transcriptional regulator [Pseudoxanthomonas broegbernensis]MBB6063745.1 AraC-like DNA-binding protein [Pseudoxanthomonas broegbernensis]